MTRRAISGRPYLLGEIVDAQRDTLGDAHPTTCDSAMHAADLLRSQVGSHG
jgi:hypothetical protein